MKFKPVTQNYIFDAKELTREFPQYLLIPVSTWIQDVLRNAGIWSSDSYQAISPDFLNNLDLLFRETTPFPRDHRDFLNFVLKNPERTINIIQLCLQNYARPSEARKMENILSTGGSAYSVMLNSSNLQEYQRGIADIVERVPKIVTESSKDVLDNNTLIQEAWHSCYSRNPDYEKTVSRCVDALEGLFKNKYFPQDQKPTLGKFVNDFIADPLKLSFWGDTLINPKNKLTDLAKEFIPIRGHHTSGTGRKPTKEEAVFVLHYTIFVFQILK
ncbi:MAG: hypothetical protein RI945_223 [Candidatus Parcubacteria bacterium]|jgi:hypothetical protein